MNVIASVTVANIFDISTNAKSFENPLILNHGNKTIYE
tara:strand:- start:1008 stop:1121 length:114 start_codon:yes stop_codon:yes gene_type:complete